ncbi:MAG TPA: type I-E CRISPR-associated protein Cas7/Cse4/CasC [Chloroflexota bacterium]|nr:type I-E CRISPR-associated protein Cas7/Cse4/CasC [Chloroflexota bacterium]
MFLEMHILQNFAPSNLNRDDTNAPKQADFGGVRRARVSSQSWKRAMRTAFAADSLLPPEDRGVRTKRLLKAIAERLTALGRPEDEAGQVARSAVVALGLGFDSKNQEDTQYLVFLGEQEITSIAGACEQYWEELLAFKPEKKGSKAPPAVERRLRGTLDGGKAADIALFGRMLADLPEHNVDAAAQVAHAISAHKVGIEFDFFTASDDLKERAEGDDMGAGMMGTVEFNSACYYRYANVDLGQLARNLQGDTQLAQAALAAFVRAFISSIPGGKQNTFAAQSRPTLILAEYRDGAPQSLADAFAKPVQGGSEGLLASSVHALDDRYGRLATMYGDGATGSWVATTEPESVTALKDKLVPNAEALVGRVLAASPYGGAA